MSILNKSMHMRITINGKSVKVHDADSVTKQIREFLTQLQAMKSHGTSSITLELKTGGFSDAAKPDDDGMAALYALAQPAQESDTIPLMTQDQIFMEYLSMMSAGNRERTTPDRLHFLRDYVERTYPEYYRAQGHHF